jgi:hypothetical protein
LNKPQGGGAATPQELANAKDVIASSATQLKNVRTAAARWQTGLLGLTGTITIFGLVKGAEDVSSLSHSWAVAYGVCLAGALVASVAAGVLAMRAAFGLPRVVTTADWPPKAATDASEAQRSVKLLRVAIGTTIASIVLVAAALGIAWYAPVAESSLLVRELSGAEDCGKVLKVAGGVLTLKTASGERSIHLAELDGMGPEPSCPGHE